MTPWTIACQALLSMELSKQEYWSVLPLRLYKIEASKNNKPKKKKKNELSENKNITNRKKFKD